MDSFHGYWLCDKMIECSFGSLRARHDNQEEFDNAFPDGIKRNSEADKYYQKHFGAHTIPELRRPDGN